MSLFRQSRDSLKELIYPLFRTQSDKLQHETRCAHQLQKDTFTYKLRKPLNHKQRVLALYYESAINYWLLGFVSLNVNQQLLNANIAIPLNSPRSFVLWIVNHQYTIIDENFKILKVRVPQRRFQITTHHNFQVIFLPAT